MAVRVGINGFGRIGRHFLRAALDTAGRRDQRRCGGGGRQRPCPDRNQRLSAQVRLNAWHAAPPGQPHGSFHHGRRPQLRGVLGTGSQGVAVGRPRCGRGDRVHRLVHERGGCGRPHRCRSPAGDHLGAWNQRGRHLHHRGKRRQLRSRPAPHRFECLVHDELFRADGQGARRRLRGGEGVDDHRPRLHERPEPPRPGSPRSAPGQGGADQHRADLDRGGPGHRSGPGIHARESSMAARCGCRSPMAPSPTLRGCSAAM